MEQHEIPLWESAVADALRSTRGVARLSQAEVGRRTGIARTSYRMYERAERQPDVIQLAQIAEAFGIPFSELVAEIERFATKGRVRVIHDGEGGGSSSATSCPSSALAACGVTPT